MSHTPHELAAAFPEYAEKMHELKQTNAHFARLFDEYHELNRAVHRAETNVEPVSPDHEKELRKTRMNLRDEIYRLLTVEA
jgi:uncharacterized protein YdcH (DUF465 family)